MGNFTLTFWALPTGRVRLSLQSNTGTDGTGFQPYAIYPTHGGDRPGLVAGLGVAVGVNGVVVYVHRANYMPPLLSWSSPGPISSWTMIGVSVSNSVPSLYIDGALVMVGLAPTAPFISYFSPSTLGGGSYGQYAGQLDTMTAYGIALTDQQMLDVYSVRSFFSPHLMYIPMCVLNYCVSL